MNETLIYNLPETLIKNIINLTNLLKAIGGFIIFYIIFQTAMIIINRKKRDELKEINKNLKEIKKILEKNSKK